MLKNLENNGMEKIGLVTPTPDVNPYDTEFIWGNLGMFLHVVYQNTEMVPRVQIVPSEGQEPTYPT